MIPIKVKDIAGAVKGRILSGDPETTISSISLDSRSLKSGDFFIPIRGEHFDGHRFIPAAIAAGAAGFFTDSVDEAATGKLPDKNVVVVEVEDSGRAFNELAGLVRSRLKARVIGITGSTGKTTTKDILAALTGESFNTLASEKNYNNEIGTPLTLTKAKPETEVLIVEMGMRGLGQIASLAGLARPEIGIVTNVGLTHLGPLGSKENIAAAKAELIEALPASGYAILNADDEWTPLLRRKTRAGVVTFGLSAGVDFGADDITLDESARPRWRLLTSGRPGPVVQLNIPGRHNIVNALAAIAAATLIGVDIETIAGGLGRVRLPEMRLTIARSQAGATIINDAYNANPASMAGALDTLVNVKPDARHIAVLGQMSELGEESFGAHKELGRLAAGLGVDRLVAVGASAQATARSALAAGMAKAAVTWAPTNEAASSLLKDLVDPGDVVLVKGSRVAGMESIADRLIREN